MNFIFLIFTGLSLLFACAQVNAVEMNDLYTATVEIKDKSAKSRSLALQQAMEAVLLKVGGQESLLKNQSIKQAVSRYKLFYDQIKYQKDETGNYLVASFNPQKITHLFISENLPIWGNLRPNVLVVLVVEQGLARSIVTEPVTATAFADFAMAIADYSEKRGIPFLLPSSENTLFLHEMWGRFPSALADAARIQDAQAAVIVRLSNSSLLAKSEETLNCPLCQQKNYALDWSFMGDIRESNSLLFAERAKSTDPLALITGALKQVSQKLYEKYASASTEKQQLEINVANINTLKEYTEVEAFLTSLTSVSSVRLIKVKGSEKYFMLSLIGTPSTFFDALKLNKELQQYVDPLNPDAATVPTFYWSKR